MNKLLLTTGIIAMFISSGISAEASAYKADKNTLLLTDFSKSAKKASYSIGPSLFSGSGASVVDGYYNKGLLLKAQPLTLNLMEKSEDTVPVYTDWGPLLDGNIRPEAGTIECFIKISSAKDQGRGFMSPHIARNVKGKKYYDGFCLKLNSSYISWNIPLWNKEAKFIDSGRVRFSKVKSFRKSLKKDWHHFALTWTKGEAVIYLDGRIVHAIDLKKHLGLAIINNARQFFHMDGCTISDFRISNIVRYKDSFEPKWHNGKRPAYAFSGVDDVKRYKAVYSKAPQADEYKNVDQKIQKLTVGKYKLSFNKKGQLLAINGIAASDKSGHGVVLHEGFKRKLLSPLEAKIYQKNDVVTIEQEFENKLKATSRISESKGCLDWKVRLENAAAKEQKVEVVISIPFKKASEYFDGLEKRNKISLPRYRDSYPYVLPLAAVASGEKYFSIALNPEFPYNDIVHGFDPSGYFQQGTKVALSAKEKFTIDFLLRQNNSDFKTAQALEDYYQRFADLYHINKEYTIYSYMPHTTHRRGLTCEDILRTGYAGGMWGHGPYHTKGDEVGKWWNMTKYKNWLSYKHAAGWEKNCGTPELLQERIAAEYKMEFDHGYPLRRYHACPNLTPKWIIEEVWPGYVSNDDMLACGNYYIDINGNYFVNEYNTPLGKHFIDQTKQYYNIGIKNNSPGWINDVTYVVAHYRFDDKIAQKTSGRSFAPDKPAFVRGAMGLQQRNDAIKKLYSNGYRCSMSWDNGSFSYTTGAHSTSSAIESGSVYETLTGHSFVPYGRNLHGQKPIIAHTDSRAIKTGNFLPPESDLKDSATIREYFRYTSEKIALFSLKNGVELDPAGYLFGNQYLNEMTPLMIDNIIRGIRYVTGATVSKPLWVKRSGTGLDSLIIVGNEKPESQSGKLTLLPKYFGGQPLLVDYFGGDSAGKITEKSTVLDINVKPRKVLAYNLLGVLKTESGASWKTSISGDGITTITRLELNSKEKAQLELRNDVPIYKLANIMLNGKQVSVSRKIILPAGRNKLELSYKCIEFKFSASDWKKVELFKSGKTNYRIVADKGYKMPGKTALIYNMNIGFEFGTAALLQNFVKFYDWEDGIIGSMKIPEIVSNDNDKYSGWTFKFELGKEHGIHIKEKKREIIVTGKTHGEIRRGVVMFLRLMDRKYPHVGSFYPLQRVGQENLDRTLKEIDFNLYIDRYNKKKDKASAALFRNLPEQDFLIKPLLNREYDKLYAEGVKDFRGRYRMKFPVFIFEPTYNDKFVYGNKKDFSSWEEFHKDAEKKETK